MQFRCSMLCIIHRWMFEMFEVTDMRSDAETTRIEGGKRPTAFCCIDCYSVPIDVGHGFLAHTIGQCAFIFQTAVQI